MSGPTIASAWARPVFAQIDGLFTTWRWFENGDTHIQHAFQFRPPTYPWVTLPVSPSAKR